jgi:iron complex transport system ATP-binding protein
MLAARALSVAVPDRVLVEGLELELKPGEFLAVLGQNGAGKSTTLNVLAGLARPARGEVTLAGRALADWPRRERALRLGLLPQVAEDPFPSTVLETVLIGRHPHLPFLAWESETDIALARAALAACDLAGAEERAVATLSGGERRRLALATVLVQDPAILLLDEPLNHLDPHHQRDVLEGLARLAREGKAVLATLHDATLAARYSSRVLLLYGDGSWVLGDTDATLNAVNLTRLYRLPVEELAIGTRRVFVAG